MVGEILDYCRKYGWIAAMLLCACVGGIVVQHYLKPTPIVLSKSPSHIQTPQSTTTRRPMVTIHIAGAVKTPGVYQFPIGTRVLDAIESVGGTTSDAKLDSINLASRLKNGQRIRIPKKKRPKSKKSSPKKTSTLTVNINTASLRELTKVPGIGISTARRIMAYRDAHGSFKSYKAITNVSGIGDKRLKKLRPYLRLK